ncbi:MAG: ABC transporter ATP-binding protein [Acholeplasmataceae bacterium]|jgi:multiple sugar transport system ATP-binding protein
MPKILLENVTKRWGDFTAVDNITLEIPDRSFITLLGPSGCGKTTILRMIAGLEDPTSGRITIDDEVVFDSEKGINVSPSKRDIGFLFQNYALWPHMTVYKNISFGLENLRWPKEEIDKRVDELLKLLKIEQFAKRYPSELSGGQQQRVAIARTLAPHPKTLFMDEPLSNLDAKLRLEMRTELKRLFNTTDSTFVYVTHDQLEAMTLSTKVCLLKTGVIEQYDDPLTVYSHPANTFVADFVGNPTMNFIDAKAKKGTNNKEIEIEFAKTIFKFEAKQDINYVPKDVIVGIRPEFVNLNSGIEGEIYSSLPSGMSTTLIIDYRNILITSVVFGQIDFEIGLPAKLNFQQDSIVLFDQENGVKFAEGTLLLDKVLPISEEELEEIKKHYELRHQEIVDDDEDNEETQIEKLSVIDKVKNIFKRKSKSEE